MEKKITRFAVPVAEGRLAMHFGHCQQFALVDADEESREIQHVTYETPPPHEPGVLPRWLGEKRAHYIIAGGMGMRAQQLFSAQGIQVITGAPSGEPEALVLQYLEGNLECGENACSH